MNACSASSLLFLYNFLECYELCAQCVDEGGGSDLVECEGVVMPVELGGPGIGCLKLHKEALLAKWLWQFFYRA